MTTTDPDLETLRHFIQQAANNPICYFGTHTGRSPQYSDGQITRALAAANRAIAERQRHDTPAWQANEKLNGTVEELCEEIERLRARLAELEANERKRPLDMAANAMARFRVSCEGVAKSIAELSERRHPPT